MPFTPFHFGPGALIHSVAPKHVSFLAFCGANVLVDVEPLYFMLTHQYPIHRFFHTYVGTTVAAGIVVALFVLARKVSRLRNLSVRAVALGAFIGTYSHVLLDSLMHADMSPFAVQRCESAVGRGASQHAARVLFARRCHGRPCDWRAVFSAHQAKT